MAVNTFLYLPFYNLCGSPDASRQVGTKNLHLKAIKTRSTTHKKYGLEGSDLRIWENHATFALHVCTHLFVPEVDEAGQCTTELRIATIDDDVVCGIYECDRKFFNTPLGNAERLIHLMRDHGLPILETEDGKAFDSREIDARAISEYMFNLLPQSTNRSMRRKQLTNGDKISCFIDTEMTNLKGKSRKPQRNHSHRRIVSVSAQT